MGQGAEDLDMAWARQTDPSPNLIHSFDRKFLIQNNLINSDKPEGTEPMANHHRAEHKVNPIGDMGYNVNFKYKGYEVSLAADGEDTHVYRSRESSQILFSSPNTSGESILKCFQFIDNL